MACGDLLGWPSAGGAPGPLEVGSLLDRSRLDEVIGRYRPAAALHLAAFPAVAEPMAEPAKHYRNDAIGTLDLLDAMRGHRIERIVFSSTAAVHGVPRRAPIDAGHPLDPSNPHGATKLACERMLRGFAGLASRRRIFCRCVGSMLPRVPPPATSATGRDSRLA